MLPHEDESATAVTVTFGDDDLLAVGESSGTQGATLVCLILSVVILLGLVAVLPWRRLRMPVPMPWDILKAVSYRRLRMVHPEEYEKDNDHLEVTEVDPAQFGTVSSGEVNVPLQELLEWVAKHPFTGYKGGLARLVGKLMWLQRGHPDLESEIEGFNDIDIIYFLQDGEENKKTEMKAKVDAGLEIGNIPVLAEDVEYSYDTIPHVLATRDLTQNQCIIVSDGNGKVFLVNAAIFREHVKESTTGPAVHSENCTLDDKGNVVASAKILGRAMIQWMKGRASSVSLTEATVEFYQKQKLPKMTQFQIFSKAKGNEMYMKVYTELVRLGFLDRVEFPHMLWGECYAHVNASIARHGYRLELESEFNSEAVERWKEEKYADQLLRSRVSVWRDFRWHQRVLDGSFTMPYSIAHNSVTHGLHAHMAGSDGAAEHRSRQHLTYLRLQGADLSAFNITGRGSIQTRSNFRNTVPGMTFQQGGSEMAGSQLRKIRESAYQCSKQHAQKMVDRIRTAGGAYVEFDDTAGEDQQDPWLTQSLFGKLTATETFMQILGMAKPFWQLFVASFLLNCMGILFYLLVINHVLGIMWLLVAAAFSAGGGIVFLTAANRAMLHVLTSLFLALLNMKIDAFTNRMFSEIWGRLTGDTKTLQSVLQSINDLTIELLTCVACTFAITGVYVSDLSCDSKPVWNALLAVFSCGALMFAMSMVAGLALRQRSRSSRSMIGFLYFNMFSTLSRYFEIKSMPEQWASSQAAYEEVQMETLEERKKLNIVEQVMHIFLRYSELAMTTLVLTSLLTSKGAASMSCAKSYSIQAVAVSMAMNSMRRVCEQILHLSSSIGSLERLILLGRALLRVAVPRFDGLNNLVADPMLEIPQEFTYCVGSPQYGPFVQIPALAAVTKGKLNTLAMPRGTGATSFGKILLRMLTVPARVKLNGVHIEQYEQELLSFNVHMIDHTPFPSSTAITPGQGHTLADYVQMGLGDSLNVQGLRLVECLEQAGIWNKVVNIPNGIESTDWAVNLSRPEAYLVQLAQAIFRISLNGVQILVVVDPLRNCKASEVDVFRKTWQTALQPLLQKVLVLVIDQTYDVRMW
eukprot:TRINITY_DN62764_c0_g1_i1.p1 TRINITY_DN62764_c0_g1~~TRINITY_DN62764_c0_g1_i1.p1  ORF type:complete len:1087 (+),score=174.09 TRINITY_DN62764_c0_g1_i1:60-3320(+)